MTKERLEAIGVSADWKNGNASKYQKIFNMIWFLFSSWYLATHHRSRDLARPRPGPYCLEGQWPIRMSPLEGTLEEGAAVWPQHERKTQGLSSWLVEWFRWSKGESSACYYFFGKREYNEWTDLSKAIAFTWMNVDWWIGMSSRKRLGSTLHRILMLTPV